MKKKIFSLLLVFIMTFTVINIDYREAKADALTWTLGAGGVLGGITVGGALALGLGLVAAGYGISLAVENWDDITNATGNFFQNATGEVRDWWDNITSSAVPNDEDIPTLPDALNTPGEIINFFDYYVPSGSGGDPENPDPNNLENFDLSPAVTLALAQFIKEYYNYPTLDPNEVYSDALLSAMSLNQLADHILYQPAKEKLPNAFANYRYFDDFGLMYILLTPRKLPELYGNQFIYGILDIPELSDTIYVGVKDDGTCVIHAMGYTGIRASNPNIQTVDPSDVKYSYPYYPIARFEYTNEPYLSTFDTRYSFAQFYNNGYSEDWSAGYGGQTLVNKKWLNSQSDDLHNGETLEADSNINSEFYDVPLSAYYRYVNNAGTYKEYYYYWDNVDFNDGNLIMGDYNINFVGGRDYFNFYQYDYEDWISNKQIYFNAFKNLTKGKGRIESYLGTTFEKFIPGESYTIPKSDYKMSIPTNKNVSLSLNDDVLQKLSDIDLSLSNNFDDIIRELKELNDANIKAGKQPIINSPIIETSPGGETPGNIEVDLSATNDLIDGLPDRIAESMRGPLSESFTPSGDFTQMNNLRTRFSNMFDFSILYYYHDLIENFIEERKEDTEPPTFNIYPKQSGLVYFKDMPEVVPVITFEFMEKQIFTWDITIREFTRAILTFFVFAVWLSRTIKKLPGLVAGIGG